MITRSDVDKLISMRAAGPAVLSLYLWVPLDLTEVRGLPARADELCALAAWERSQPGAKSPVRVGRQDRQTVRGLLTTRARDFLGHTVAIFASAELGLAEAIPLPVRLQERAVLAARPHVRPLLLAIQRQPAYRVVVADRRHAWLFSVVGEQIRATAMAEGKGLRSRSFSGWYGLEAYRVNDRIIELARQHYRATAAMLDRAAHAGGPEPLVIGGHEDTIPQVLAALPDALREQFAGSFVADAHTLTPARVRKLADRVIENWLSLSDQRLSDLLRQEPLADLTATGLTACLAAANQHAIRLLVVPDGGLPPGLVCERCGALSSSSSDWCPHGAQACTAVPDLIEELVVATLADGGQVRALRNPAGGIAALLRFQPAR